MTEVHDLHKAAEDVVAALTGPGGQFEIVEEEVLGVRMKVFKNRTRSLGALLTASTMYGDDDSLVTAARRLSFARHARQVASLATVLRDDYGVRRGDRVAISAANSPEWVVSFWATVS